MATPADAKQFADFFEAFCHRFDCPADRFERRAFFMAVPLWKRPVVWVMLQVMPELFDIDLDIVEELGKTRTRDEFSGVLDEFHNAMRVTRSTLKKSFGMRMQGGRLMEIREEMDDLIRTPVGGRRLSAAPADPVNPAPSPVPRSAPAPTAAAAPGSPASTRAARVPTESRALMLRKTRQVHAAVTGGIPLAQALAEAGLEEAQLLDLLAAEAGSNPGFGWLRDQLLRERRLQEAEAELARLNRAVTDQSREIAELRDRLAPGA